MKKALAKFTLLVALGTALSAFGGTALAGRDSAQARTIHLRIVRLSAVCDGESAT